MSFLTLFRGLRLIAPGSATFLLNTVSPSGIGRLKKMDKKKIIHIKLVPTLYE